MIEARIVLRGGSCCRGVLWSNVLSLRLSASSEPLVEEDVDVSLDLTGS